MTTSTTTSTTAQGAATRRHADGAHVEVTTDTPNRGGRITAGRELVAAGWTGTVEYYASRKPDPEHGPYVCLRLDEGVGEGNGGYRVTVPEGLTRPTGDQATTAAAASPGA